MHTPLVLQKKRTTITHTASITPIKLQATTNTHTGVRKAVSAYTPKTHNARKSKYYNIATNLPSTVTLNDQSFNTQELLLALLNQHILQERAFITTDEFARLLSIKPQTIAKWRSSNVSDLPTAIQIGRQIRYDLSDAMQWAEKHRLVS